MNYPLQEANSKLPIVLYITIAHQIKIHDISTTEITATGVSQTCTAVLYTIYKPNAVLQVRTTLTEASLIAKTA